MDTAEEDSVKLSDQIYESIKKYLSEDQDRAQLPSDLVRSMIIRYLEDNLVMPPDYELMTSVDKDDPSILHVDVLYTSPRRIELTVIL